MMVETRFGFELPGSLEATEPPEARGIRRDGVRLLVASQAGLVHTTFDQLGRFLGRGDVVVVNTSATLAAALAATTEAGHPVLVHLSTQLSDHRWAVELRDRDGAGPASGARPGGGPASGAHPGGGPAIGARPGGGPAIGARSGGGPAIGARAGLGLRLAAGARAELLSPYRPPPGRPARLWVAEVHLPGPPAAYLAEHGTPIRYRHVPRLWPLADYQSVYSDQPGSAEMPSAGRPFSLELVAALAAAGVGLAPLVLHTGVSSLEVGEPPYPERFRVPAATARQVNQAHAAGRRVVAVGTTVVRALETVADTQGVVRAGQGWTDLVITAERRLRAVDGLVTGWHQPGATHLDLLEAVAGRDLLVASYREALEHGYLWHEFGDSHLILP